jgi:hypothetical protein
VQIEMKAANDFQLPHQHKCTSQTLATMKLL